MAKNVHESGDQKKGGGGWSKDDSRNFRAALDGVGTGGGSGDSDSKGEKPKTGAMRDISSTLDGNER